MVKYYLELWFHFVCTVVLLLVPFLLYNLLCSFSVISLLFSKGCWLCVNWTHYALTLLCVCVCVVYAARACDPWPATEGALQAEIFACGNGLRKRVTQQALGSAASSLRVPADGSGDAASSPGSLSLCSLNRSRFKRRGRCVLGAVWGPSAQQMSSSVSCKINKRWVLAEARCF